MNIPSLPVDSTYKFYAIAGLVVIIFCLYSFSSLVETIHDKALKVQLELKKGSVEIEFIQSQQGKISQLMESAKKGTVANDVLKKGNIPIEVTKDEYKKMLNELERLTHDERIKSAEVGVLIEELKRLESRMHSYLVLTYGATLFGLVLSSGGFIFWHLRIQRYQDQIIRNEAIKGKIISS